MVYNIRLFESTATQFNTMGLGLLNEATKCVVKEELNGIFTLTMEYPVTGKRFSDLKTDRLIVVNPNPYDNPQAFVIVSISIPINNIVTIEAQHISYLQSRYPLKSLDTRTGMLNLANEAVTDAKAQSEIEKLWGTGKEIIANIWNSFFQTDEDNVVETFDSGVTDPYKPSWATRKAQLAGLQKIRWTDPGLRPRTSPSGTRPEDKYYLVYKVNGEAVDLFDFQKDGNEMSFTTPGNGTLYWYTTDSSTRVFYQYKTLTLSKILEAMNSNMLDIETSRVYPPVGPQSNPFSIVPGWVTDPRSPGYSTDTNINPDIDPYNLTKDMAIEEKKPLTLRSALGQKIPEKYKIEYKFDNFVTKVYGKKGRGRRYSDTGFEIRYGKNMTDLTKKIGDQNNEEYTHVYPFWHSERSNIIKRLSYIDDEHNNNPIHKYDKLVPIIYDDNKVRPLNIYLYDLSTEFSLMPDGEEMADKTDIFIRKNDMNVSKVSIKVSFEDLSRYPEFGETMKNLYQVELGDDVKVIVPNKGINDILQCVKTEFDVISGKYNSIELGQPIYGVANTISSQKVQNKKNQNYSSVVAAALSQSASGISSGFKGSYIATLTKNPENGMSFDDDDYPNEFIIADSQDFTTANMWRWNKNGLMFQTGGWHEIVPGENVTIAITNDGKINADAILTGSLVAGRADAEGNPILKITKDPNTPDLDSFLLNIKNSAGEQLIKIDSANNSVILNATSITTGTLSISDGHGGFKAIIPTDPNGVGYIDNNGIELKNIDATNIVTGTLAVREVRSGGYTAATSAELFDNVTWPAEDHPNTYAKVSNETSITPTGIQNGRWYKSAATFEVVIDLGDYAWEEVGTAPYKYWRMTTQLPDIYTDYATTTVPSVYVYGYKTVAQTAWSSRSDYQCSLLPEGTGKRLVIDNPELRGKTAAYVKSYFTGTKVYYKVISAAERLTYKWYPNDDYWYWTHFGTTYPNASTGLIDINTRIGSFYISGNALFQGLPGRESRFSENGVFLSTGIAAAYTIGTGVNVRGWCLGIGGKFGVTIEGNLYASNAYIQGRVDADEGYIGGLSIKESGLTALIKDTYSSSARYSGIDTTNAEADIRFAGSGASGSYIDGNVRFYTGRSENSDYGQVTSLETYVTYAKNNAVISNLAITQDGGLISRKIAILDPTLKSASGGSIRGTYLIFSHKYLTESHIDTSTQRMTGTYAEWTQIIDNVTNTTSDANYKHDITDLTDKYNILFDRLRPVSYKYNNGTSGRDHTGFIAQEVHNAIIAAGLTEKNFAAIITSHEHNDDTGEDIEIMRLRRDEFVALNTWQIQKLKQKVPNPPDEDGDYVLKCSKVNGIETYSWVTM